jgi:hypothetical protein
VLLGDADIEAALREALGEFIEAGARRHGGGDGDDALVDLGLGDQGLGEDAGIARGTRLRLDLLAGGDVEFYDAVIFIGGRLGQGA